MTIHSVAAHTLEVPTSSSEHLERVSALQLLSAVRKHWGITQEAAHRIQASTAERTQSLTYAFTTVSVSKVTDIDLQSVRDIERFYGDCQRLSMVPLDMCGVLTVAKLLAKAGLEEMLYVPCQSLDTNEVFVLSPGTEQCWIHLFTLQDWLLDRARQTHINLAAHPWIMEMRA